MKVYKRLSTAKANANNLPLLRVGEFYITSMTDLDQISIVEPDGTISGHVSVRKLRELGNANWAVPAPKWVERIRNDEL